MSSPSPIDVTSHLIPAASDRPGNDPIFALNAEAQAARREGRRVVNASLGALLNDDGTLAVLPSVTEAFRSVDPAAGASYAPIAGDAPFLAAVVEDVFGTGPLAGRAIAVATAGGTGAVHHAVVNFLEPGQALTTASYYWGPYRTIAVHTGREVDTFRMFTDTGAFDLEALERSVAGTLERQGRALVILNSPCNNPTGHSLDDGEWTGLARILADAGRSAPVSLLVDLAYARYGHAGSERWVEHLEGLVEHVPLLVAWSASKAFTQYGSRVGALLAVVSDDRERDQVHNALSFSCRGTWSNCNHLGILAITSLLSDPERRARVDVEREELRGLLDERVAAFNREARAAGLRTPRYEGGFFVAVFTPDAPATVEAAKREGVFVVPMDGAVRVALCSTPKDDVPYVVEVLARAVASAAGGR